MLREQLARVAALESGRFKGRRIESFRKEWQRACRAAKLEGLLVHDLRRSAVRNMERGGIARSVAMKITGHKTESVYRRYAIVSDSDLKEAARALSAQSARAGG